MKKFLFKTYGVFAAIFVIFLMLTVCAFAEDNAMIRDDFSWIVSCSDSAETVHLQKGLNGDTYLFLPSSADYANMAVAYDDQVYSGVKLSVDDQIICVENNVPFDCSILQSERSENKLVLSAQVDGGIISEQITVMRSANIRSLFLTSDDPEQYGREYVDESKNNDQATGSYALIDSEGNTVFSGVLTQIKGRGNSSFIFEKKPYQIKLEKKATLVDGAGKSKKWVLLANVPDPSLIRNALTFSAADELALNYTCRYDFVDLYYDGFFRGNYMLTEKVEVGDSRVEIDKTDDLIESVNAGTDAFENPVTKTVSAKTGAAVDINSSGSYRYVDGLTEPEFPTGALHHAYLLEFEFANRYPDELTGFITDRAQRIVTKSPEYLTKEQGAYIASFWQEFEDAVYSPNGYNSKTGKYYYEYCDLDSLAKCYLFNEISKNSDYYGSSTFFYLAADSDLLYCGPLWDYDIAYGIGWGQSGNASFSSHEYFYVAEQPFAKALLNIPSFREELKKLTAADGDMTAVVNHLTENGGVLDSLAAEIDGSQQMEYKIWDITNAAYPQVYISGNTTFDSAVEDLERFITERYAWLTEEISQWTDDSYEIKTAPPAETKPQKSSIEQLIEDIVNIFRAILNWFRNLFTK